MLKKIFPIKPAHPERVCWGCDRYCPGDDMVCGNGSERTQHPCELSGDEWEKEWAIELDPEMKKCIANETILCLGFGREMMSTSRPVVIDFPGHRAPNVGFEVPLEMLAACHHRVQSQCETLLRLVIHMAEHGCDPSAQETAISVMRYFDTAALHHHEDEEQDLFPALLESMAGSDAMCLRELTFSLTSDHIELEGCWRALRLKLERVAGGSDVAWADDEVPSFIGRYKRHIEREETELLPMAQRLLSDSELDRIGLGCTQLDFRTDGAVRCKYVANTHSGNFPDTHSGEMGAGQNCSVAFGVFALGDEIQQPLQLAVVQNTGLFGHFQVPSHMKNVLQVCFHTKEIPTPKFPFLDQRHSGTVQVLCKTCTVVFMASPWRGCHKGEVRFERTCLLDPGLQVRLIGVIEIEP